MSGASSSRPGSDATPARILILASFAESVVSFRGPLIRALVARGLTVHVCAPFAASPAASEEVARLGAQPVHLGISRTGINPLKDAAYLLGLIRVAWSLKPEVVLAYTAKPVIYGLVAAWVAGVRRRYALITGLGYAFADRTGWSFLSWVVRFLYRWSLKRATLIFFQNPDDERLFRSLGLVAVSCPTTVVNGSGIDVDSYVTAPLPEGAARFLMIGRLLGAKGVREYVLAARSLSQRHPRIRCALAGWIDDGPDAIDQKELDSWIADGAIDFLGRLDDVRPAIRDCSVYVLPSYREGTPRTVLEAMAMGRAIVTTDVPGCRETVDDGENGFLVPARSVTGLIAAMERLAADEPLRTAMGQASRRIAEDKYDVTKVNEAMLREMEIAR